MIRLIPIIVLIVDILAIIDILKGYKDNEKKVLWIAIVVLVPGLGALFYFLVGRQR